MKALGKNKKALQTFDEFSYSHKKEYVEWITEAKTEETRNKRMATAIEMDGRRKKQELEICQEIILLFFADQVIRIIHHLQQLFIG